MVFSTVQVEGEGLGVEGVSVGGVEVKRDGRDRMPEV